MSGVRILLVEDNEGDARLIREMLAESRQEVFEVVHVRSLSEALSELKKGGIHVVLLDLFLPDSFGLATVMSVYVAAPEVPLVVMSGTDDETLIAKAIEEGAQDYLVKNHINSDVLAHSIRFAVERQRLLNEKLASTTDVRWLLIRRWLATLDAKLDAIAKAVGITPLDPKG